MSSLTYLKPIRRNESREKMLRYLHLLVGVTERAFTCNARCLPDTRASCETNVGMPHGEAHDHITMRITQQVRIAHTSSTGSFGALQHHVSEQAGMSRAWRAR